MDRRLSMTEVRRLSGFSEDTILREIRRGNLPATKVLNRWRFRESAVLQWLNPKSQNAPASGGDRSRAMSGRAGANANYAGESPIVGGSSK